VGVALAPVPDLPDDAPMSDDEAVELIRSALAFDWLRVEVPHLEVSSTDLRARFVDGRPLDYLITEPVLDVIRQRDLYGAAS